MFGAAVHDEAPEDVAADIRLGFYDQCEAAMRADEWFVLPCVPVIEATRASYYRQERAQRLDAYGVSLMIPAAEPLCASHRP